MSMCERNKPKESGPQAGGVVQGQAGLSPCWKCGSPKVGHDTQGPNATEVHAIAIRCDDCGARSKWCTKIESAYEDWNQRAPSLSVRGGREGVGVSIPEAAEDWIKTNAGWITRNDVVTIRKFVADLVEKGKHNLT